MQVFYNLISGTDDVRRDKSWSSSASLAPKFYFQIKCKEKNQKRSGCDMMKISSRNTCNNCNSCIIKLRYSHSCCNYTHTLYPTEWGKWRLRPRVCTTAWHAVTFVFSWWFLGFSWVSASVGQVHTPRTCTHFSPLDIKVQLHYCSLYRSLFVFLELLH